MLLVSAPGSREERTERNSRFHALNQAIVQLVRVLSCSGACPVTESNNLLDGICFDHDHSDGWQPAVPRSLTRKRNNTDATNAPDDDRAHIQSRQYLSLWALMRDLRLGSYHVRAMLPPTT